jgi:hypothetical protein
VHKARPSGGRNVEFFVINVTLVEEKPTKFHTGEDLIEEERNFPRMLLYDEFLEVLQHIDSPHVSRQWDDPIEATGPMKRQRLNILSLTERGELNRQLKDAVEVGLIRPSHSEFGSPIRFVPKASGSLRLCLTTVALARICVEDAICIWTTHSI